MPLTYVTVTGTFDDGSGASLSGTATFTPSATVYASGVPVVTEGLPVNAQIINGLLKNSQGGSLTLLGTDNTGLTIEGQTPFWYWSVSLSFAAGAGQSWSFFLPKATSPVELFALNSSGAAALYVPLAGGTMTGELVAPDVNISGLTGATAASRYVGGTSSGAPGSGTFAVGDFVIDHAGKVWICTTAGSPGTWTAAGPTIPVTIAQGGTNATTASVALSNLGAAALAGATFTGAVDPAVVALTFGSTISVNAAQGNVFAVTLTASTGTIANPTNPVDGQVIRYRIAQDGTGSRTVAWGTAYDWGSTGGLANSAPTLSTGASKVDVLGFEYNAALSKWVYLGAAFPQGF